LDLVNPESFREGKETSLFHHNLADGVNKQVSRDVSEEIIS
jgi:hypothetical protein